MADIPVYDKTVDEKTIPAHTEPARERYNPYTELKKDDVVAVRVFLNGKEVDGRKYWQEKDEEKGKMRVYTVELRTEIVNKPPVEVTP